MLELSGSVSQIHKLYPYKLLVDMYASEVSKTTIWVGPYNTPFYPCRQN